MSLAGRVRRSRGPVVVGVLILVAAAVLAIAGTRVGEGLLEPAGVDPSGSGALVAVLREQGVRVDVATRPEDVVGAGPATTVLVAFPERLGTAGRLALAHAGSDVVLVAPDAATLEALAPGVRRTEPPSSLTTTGVVPTPDCALPAARAAGPLVLDGDVYELTPPAVGCYPTDGTVPLAVSGRTVVVGTPGPFTNETLDRNGNAALVLTLLGAHPRVLWYLPAPGAGGDVSVADLVPRGVVWGTVMLLLAGGAAALWRGRRLGPVVAERLPVRVAAAETTRGRAALYRRIGARGRAAAILRADARRRWTTRLGLPPDAPTPAVGKDLLDGPEPADDAALVQLADDLDDLVSGDVAQRSSTRRDRRET
ncbi:DUF4350 domain-containing protein [Actinomycetospora termitidis]|uniref:DUF4350 domain-containing protein n=1 Tax=Actinomycetospora termitidis TaxID=3053470 RepID=A0ABT7MBT6_9PSEU|nr:DUF4350 domain-containing protein [Actinomycetospora sp. Odt1-22]MDL5158103.1 DUF4350 domain-containing protein [Actinomycetospora sp. Odt1-22]